MIFSFLCLFGCGLTEQALPPEELTLSELGTLFPPTAGRYNAFSSKFGLIYRDTSCFVLWNEADDNGQIPHITVPCPATQPDWTGCNGVLIRAKNEMCQCQPLDALEPFSMECPK